MMNTYYQNLKTEVKLVDQAGIEDDDLELDGILKTLKPNTTAKNFKEFLRKEDNNIKNQEWRAISRKIHADEEKKKKLIE
jgi:hypothetical protein